MVKVNNRCLDIINHPIEESSCCSIIKHFAGGQQLNLFKMRVRRIANRHYGDRYYEHQKVIIISLNVFPLNIYDGIFSYLLLDLRLSTQLIIQWNLSVSLFVHLLYDQIQLYHHLIAFYYNLNKANILRLGVDLKSNKKDISLAHII